MNIDVIISFILVIALIITLIGLLIIYARLKKLKEMIDNNRNLIFDYLKKKDKK